MDSIFIMAYTHGKKRLSVSRLNERLTDHKLIFPAVTIASFYIFPYTLGLLRPRQALLSFPTAWMWGLFFFAVASYFIGVLLYNLLRRLTAHRLLGKRTRMLLLLAALYASSLRLLLLYDFPLPISAMASIAIAVAIHLTVEVPSLDKRSSTIVAISLAAVLANFVLIGGVPLLNSTLLTQAKLSAVREFALPLFLLGAVSLSLRPRRKSAQSYGIQVLLFAIGASVFLMNGKRSDVLTVLLCYLVLFMRSHKPKVSFAILLTTVITLLWVAFTEPSYLGLFRQEFNFQVLRHIIYYVQDPLLGATHGATSLGISQDFSGAHLIYGPGEDWTLTATWLGPAYLDLGLLGVFITMASTAAVLEHLWQSAKKSLKSEVVYIVTLAVFASLYEEGADLFTLVFALAMLYASVSAGSLPDGRGKGAENLFGNFRTRRLALALALAVAGMAAIAYAFEAEYGLSTSVVERELVGSQITLHVRMKAEYYHVELVSSKVADYVKGQLLLLGPNGTSEEFDFDGLFWEAQRDMVDVAWLKPRAEGEYSLQLLLSRPQDLPRTSIKVEQSPLSHLMPNHLLLELGVAILVASCPVVWYATRPR